jgi:hypothetical protein
MENDLTKKYLLFANLVLAVIFIFKLFALNAEIGGQVTKKPDSFDAAPIRVQRPQIKAEAEYRNIFGVEPSERTAPPPSNPSTITGHNELVMEGEIIRLRAVFITKSDRHAVISISNKKTPGEITDLKIGIGEKVRGFTVSAIQATHISLSTESSEPFQLRIFEPSKN